MTISNEMFTTQKNRKKRIRVGLQLIFIVAVLAGCAAALFTFKSYQPYTEKNTKISGDQGFIALSYFGVERNGNQTLIGTQRLQEHLQALRARGYVTITQEDISNYYHTGKNLPEKSLFLIFEDGRRDTAIFSQPILSDLNFKATMLTYSENFEKKEPKFLSPKDIKSLEKTTFWEMGSNGHRLFFINVFDRYDTYLGEMGPLEHVSVAPYLGRKYNHYLMDFIRDEYGVPKESQYRMKERISYDYETLRDQYKQALGDVPAMYILMHSNTGSFGNNDKVSAVNAHWIKELFQMNFNREGFSFNQRNSSIYDLTRMQPQAYWYTNHLLMRIQYDTGRALDFVKGDLTKQKAWETLKGALEIQDETLVLTSLPLDKGLMRLKNSNDFKDVKLSVRLKGNQFGLQRIYLRADETISKFVSVYILNNILYITEKLNGSERELYVLPLDQHDGKAPISIPEDKKAVAIGELKTFARYAPSVEKAKIYTEQIANKNSQAVASVAEGAAVYVPLLSVHVLGDRQLNLSLKNNLLSVAVDGKSVVDDLQVATTGAGPVYLETAWGGYGWSQRNLADDVYDGVFETLVISENTGVEEEKILFDGRMQGLDAWKFKVKNLWNRVINWFIATL